MNFGTRTSIHAPVRTPASKEACPRCRGIGWARERGSKITCKACNGTGRVEAKTARAS
jgi:DnaJ-class molecular chaperone